MSSAHEVAAVIVTYQPDAVRVGKMLEALKGEVSHAVIVDNASDELPEHRWRLQWPTLVLRRLAVNKGVGAAQNEGVAVAAALGATHVLLLDQDSAPSSGMVSNLLAATESLARRGLKAGCVGPQRRRPGSAESTGFTQLGWLGVRKLQCDDSSRPVQCDFVVASGSLVPLSAWHEVGGMEEELFIDLVDTEWCLRARSKGYGVYGAAAVLEHTIGEAGRQIGVGRQARLPRHKPFRYYYIFRNSFLLARRPYVPLKFVLFQFRLLAATFFLVGVLGGRWLELRMMARGMYDGLRGVTGRVAVAHR
jgi:rhamnosyltransferase